MRSRLTNAAVAAELGISERYLYGILEGGTPSRDLAKRIARIKGGKPEDFLREPRRKGRRRAYPFRDFVDSFGEEVPGNLAALIEHFTLRYFSKGRLLPDDFSSLEELISYVRNARIEGCAPDAAPLTWKRFRIWRVQQKAAEEVFAIEMEDDLVS